MRWYCEPSNDVVQALDVDPRYGLSLTEVETRRAEHGYNKLTGKKKTNIIIRFFAQLNDFMIIVLLAAAGMSLFISFLSGEMDFLDPIIILFIVILNAVLGLVQESKAEKSIEALQKMASPHAKVLRDGVVSSVDTELLVPGDIIVLETGDLVPSDARLLNSVNLKVEESALTGESFPVEKDAEVVFSKETPLGDRRNMVFSGSAISFGRCRAVVVYTGMSTEVGKIAHMIMSDDAPATPLQIKLEKTGKFLGILALGVCVCIFFMGLLRGIPPFQMFMTSVSLAVAAIPEGLAAIVTIMLAIGVQRMAKENAIIRKLPAVETLGSASVICSDKTGTLTQNKMTVVEIWSGNSNDIEQITKDKCNILKLSAMCNDTIVDDSTKDISFTGDPTETALVAAAYKMNLKKTIIDEELPRVKEVPFDSKRKLMSTIHKSSNGDYLVITKGAPDVLIDKCSHYFDGKSNSLMSSARKKDVLSQNKTMAEKALRVLAVAYKVVKDDPWDMTEDAIENSLIFTGLIGMIDPPREEAREAVQTCISAGIKPVMVTGDHVITAMAIAEKIGIMQPGGKAITGEELSRLSQEELVATIDRYCVFARVSPEHKVRIVKAYRASGAVVAMTGDGVNDAPALKAADIGCAMGISGTDVAKGAADMVLTDDNFATIVKAVKEGRGIYANIGKAVHFLLSSNMGEIITIFTSILLGWATPLLAIHLLWVNLVTDSLPAIALALEPVEDGIMSNKPHNSKKGLFADGLWARILLEGLMIGLLALIAFGIGDIYFDENGYHIVGRTMAFATLSISQLVHAFNMRSEKSIFSINLFSNLYLIGAFAIGVILQVTVITFAPLASVFRVVPLNSTQWLIVALLSVMPLIIIEGQKLAIRLLASNKGKNYNFGMKWNKTQNI